MAVFPVIIDSCVLFNAPVRDTLLRAAEYGLYRVQWSERILEDTRKNLIRDTNVSADKANRLMTALQEAFPEAIVGVPEPLIETMKNDPKDRHVAAAAVVASAQVIVTFNVRDFKSEHLSEFNIEAQEPDTFMLYLFSRQPSMMITILIEQAADLNGINFDQLMAKLEKHVPRFIAAVRAHLT